jgi:MHS family proline/betaine transporter-like MFS transporter
MSSHVACNKVSSSSNLRRVILSCMIGNALEWYDFALYGYFVAIIAQLFFPPSADTVSLLLKSYGLFFVGFIMRPLGAIIFGYIGDRHGRKKALMWSIYLMAIPTALIGILPTYAQIGVWAPILLTFLRLFQGASMGGEFTGSMIFIVEHAEGKRRGFWGSWSSLSVLVGLITGSGVCALLSYATTSEQLATWGWRIPFLLSIVGSIVGSYMRTSLEDPRSYQEQKEEKRPFLLGELFRSHAVSLCKVVLIDLTIAIGFFIICIFIMTYLQKFVGFSYREAATLNTLSMVVFAAMIPVSGWASDRYGRRPVMLVAVLGFLFFSPFLFYGLSSGNVSLALWSQMGLSFLMGINFAPIPAILAEQFPMHLRYSGVSIAHNLSMAVFGGTAPHLVTFFIDKTGNLLVPGFYLSLAALGSFIGLLWMKDRYKEPLD